MAVRYKPERSPYMAKFIVPSRTVAVKVPTAAGSTAQFVVALPTDQFLEASKKRFAKLTTDAARVAYYHDSPASVQPYVLHWWGKATGSHHKVNAAIAKVSAPAPKKK